MFFYMSNLFLKKNRFYVVFPAYNFSMICLSKPFIRSLHIFSLAY